MEQIGQFMQPVAAAWRGHAEFGVALRVERLVRLFSVEPGNRRRLRDPAADGLLDSFDSGAEPKQPNRRP